MRLLVVFIILTIILTIIIYVRKTEKGERLGFTSLSTLLQTIFVFITLGITIYIIRSGNSSTQQLFDNLNNFNNQFSNINSSMQSVSHKLKEIPELIEIFSESIDSLNIVIKQQKDDFQENTNKLNKTIEELSTTLDGYEKNINDYSLQLKSIVDLTGKQLIIWKDQQRVLLDEFSRKPILRIDPKETKFLNDTCEIIDLVLVNDGNIEAYIRVIYLVLPPEGLVSLDSPWFEYYKKFGNEIYYKFNPYDTNVEIIAAGSDIIIACKLKVLKIFKDKIGFRVDYYSKYKSDKEINNIIIK